MAQVNRDAEGLRSPGPGTPPVAVAPRVSLPGAALERARLALVRGEPSEAAKGERQRLYRFAALLILVFAYRDFAVPWPGLLRPLIVRLVWCAALLGCGELLRRPGPVSYRAAVRIAGVASAICCGYLGICVGGTRGFITLWLPALPLAALVIAQEEWVGIVLTGLAVHVMLLVTCAGEGLPLAAVAGWQANTAASSLLAYFASREYGRRMADEHDALVRLGDSEQRRSRSERLATVGRLAGGSRTRSTTRLPS